MPVFVCIPAGMIAGALLIWWVQEMKQRRAINHDLELRHLRIEWCEPDRELGTGTYQKLCSALDSIEIKPFVIVSQYQTETLGHFVKMVNDAGDTYVELHFVGGLIYRHDKWRSGACTHDPFHITLDASVEAWTEYLLSVADVFLRPVQVEERPEQIMIA